MTAVAITIVVVYVYFLLITFIAQELQASDTAMKEDERTRQARQIMREQWRKMNDDRAPEVNVLALVKGTERYVFLYDDAHRADTLRTLGRYASDPSLSFTWYDAALLAQKVREGRTTERVDYETRS